VTVTAAPDGLAYRVVLVWRGPPANRNQIVADLTDARSIRLHFDLYGPATADCVVDGRSSSAAQLQELSQDLCVYRWNPLTAAYVILFRGPIGHTQDDIGETTHTVQIRATDYRAMIARRPVNAPLSFSAVEQFTIMQNLALWPPPINHFTPPWDMGITTPILVNPDGSSLGATGVVRDRNYVGSEKAGDMIDQLAAVINGFDWGCEPVEPGGATPTVFPCQPYVWYPRRGVTKTFTAEYGSTLAHLTRTVDSTTFANWVRNDGQPASGGAATFATSAGDAITNPQLHAEGLWPEGISNASTTDPATLQQQSDGRLGLDSILTPSYALTLTANAWQTKADAWLGDTIGVKVVSGRLNVNTTARIIQFDIAVDDNMVETVTPTVARAVPTLGDILSDTQSQLDAVSRR
jgi:hypothetical protein